MNKQEIKQYIDSLFNQDSVAIDADGTKRWYQYGVLHRENGPAVEYPGGTKYWYLNGKCHRTDGPALIWVNADGSWDEYYFKNGKIHRTDGPAYTSVNADGSWEEFYHNIVCGILS
jgi:hypothetical protein